MLSPFRLAILVSILSLWGGIQTLWAVEPGEVDATDTRAMEKRFAALAAQREEAYLAHPTAESAEQLARTLQGLGVVQRLLGKPNEALKHLVRACELYDEHRPTMLTDAIEAKAMTLQDLGRLEESEKNLKEVISARELETSETAGNKLSNSIAHLAHNLLQQGRYPEVGPLLDRSMETANNDPATLIQLLDDQGRLQHTLGSYARAIGFYEAALGLLEDPENVIGDPKLELILRNPKSLTKLRQVASHLSDDPAQRVEDPETALILRSQIALAQLRLGRIDKAKEGMETAEAEAQELYRSEPLRAVPYTNNLGELYMTLGSLVAVGSREKIERMYQEKAETAFESCLATLERELPKNHPSLMRALNNLAVARQAAEDYAGAQVLFERADSLQREHLPPTHLRVAETQRNLARNALLLKSPENTTFEAVERATLTGLALLDKLIKEGTETERLNFLERFELHSLPCATGNAELIADVLVASKARLLDSMLNDSSEKYRSDWKAVQKTLQPGSAFVDTCRYYTIEASSKEQYGAVVILPSGPPKWIPLGPANELRIWLDSFRKRLVWRSASLSGEAGPPPALKLKGILRALHRGFWEPIAEQLPSETQHIAYSPSGSLHFLPLSALLDEGGQTLSKRYLQIASVSSGRDLLENRPATNLSDKPWAVLTVSDFPKSQSLDGMDPLLSRLGENLGPVLLDLLGDLGPMPGTRNEAERIRRISPENSVFHFDEASSEEALKSLSFTPSVLHLGSHAFFLDDPVATSGIPVDFDERSDLFFSGGLVLYRGADRKTRRSPESDDLLFPSEIAELPLEGTRLVTLSSCESGAGTPVSGEGVLGLRRAFSIAGAREVLVALWPVSDASTPKFMEQFYRLAIDSDRPAQALWQTQSAFLSTAKDDDSFELAVLRYAPFVLSQNTPLTTGPAIPTKKILTEDPNERPIWLYVVAVIPFLLFVLARATGSRRS